MSPSEDPGNAMKLVRAWIRVAAEGSIFKRALATSLVVGVVLTLVNHGEEILSGRLGAGQAWPIGVTFVIPFAVATISSVSAIRATRRPIDDLGVIEDDHVASPGRPSMLTSLERH